MARGASFAINSYSYTLHHTALDCVRRWVAEGSSEFELMMYPGHLWPGDLDTAGRRTLRADIEALGARVITLNMPNVDLNVAGAAREMREYTLGLLEGVVGLAGDLGAEGVVIGLGKANPLFPAPTERLTGHFYAALDRLLPLANRAGTALWVENMPFSFIPSADGIMTALDRYGAPEIGVVYDVANGVFIGEDAGDGLRRVTSRLKLVHLSDTGRQAYRHDPVGRGVVPFADLPPVLVEIGHARRPVLEIISTDADRDIADSADRLLAMGWGRP